MRRNADVSSLDGRRTLRKAVLSGDISNFIQFALDVKENFSRLLDEGNTPFKRELIIKFDLVRQAIQHMRDTSDSLVRTQFVTRMAEHLNVPEPHRTKLNGTLRYFVETENLVTPRHLHRLFNENLHSISDLAIGGDESTIIPRVQEVRRRLRSRMLELVTQKNNANQAQEERARNPGRRLRRGAPTFTANDEAELSDLVTSVDLVDRIRKHQRILGPLRQLEQHARGVQITTTEDSTRTVKAIIDSLPKV